MGRTGYVTFQTHKSKFKATFDGQLKNIEEFKFVEANVVNPYIRIHAGNCMLPLIFIGHQFSNDDTYDGIHLDGTDNFNSNKGYPDPLFEQNDNNHVSTACVKIPLKDYSVTDLIATLNTGINNLMTNNGDPNNLSSARDDDMFLQYYTSKPRNWLVEHVIRIRNQSYVPTEFLTENTGLLDQIYFTYDKNTTRVTLVNKLLRTSHTTEHIPCHI